MIAAARTIRRRLDQAWVAISTGGYFVGLFVDLDTRRKVKKLEQRLAELERGIVVEVNGLKTKVGPPPSKTANSEVPVPPPGPDVQSEATGDALTRDEELARAPAPPENG